MRILMLTDFFLSGQTTHVLDLVKQLQKLECQVHVSFGSIHSRLFWSDYGPSLRAGRISFSQERDLHQLFLRADRWQPDLIHCQSSTLFTNTQFLSLRLRVPYVLTCHGLGFRHPKYRAPLKQADAIVAIGPLVAAELEEYMHKVTVISNGIDTDRFSPPPERNRSRRKVIYVGRIEGRRLEALDQLAKAHVNVTDAPLTIISDWNPNLPGTTFLPWQVDLVPQLQKAGIVVACGRTAREALSCGNVVLLMQRAYDGVVSPELVGLKDFDFSGNLSRFPLREIENDLKGLLRSNYKLRKLQNWGRRFALERLSSLEMAEKTKALYHEVLTL